MTSALEAWHWLEELNYNARWFSECGPRISRQLGLLRSFPQHAQGTEDYVAAVIEHCDEMKRACEQLLKIIEEDTDHATKCAE